MIDVLRVLVEKLQELATTKIKSLSMDVGTCSREFLSVVDELEKEVVRLGERYGLQRIDARLPVFRDDLRIAVFIAEGAIVEVGLKGLNRCGVLGELLGGEKTPIAYGRILGPGAKVLAEIQGERKEKRTETTYYLY